jgi:hypothetical protein
MKHCFIKANIEKLNCSRHLNEFGNFVITFMIIHLVCISSFKHFNFYQADNYIYDHFDVTRESQGSDPGTFQN